MSNRSLNKVMLIGNLTRDPELRYTPQGTAVCNFGLATNRSWTNDQGESKESVEFHRIVAWNKLAEICSQLLFKGRRAYVEGRLQTRQWEGQDGTKHQTTETIISDMILLDSRRTQEENISSGSEKKNAAEGETKEKTKLANSQTSPGKTNQTPVKGSSNISDKTTTKATAKNKDNQEDINAKDIPF